MNVDGLSRNLVGPTMDDDDFSEEIQDIRSMQIDTLGVEDEILFIQNCEGSEWLGFRRQKRKFF